MEWKSIKQEKDEGSGEIPDKVERIYSGRRHLGKKGKILKNTEELIEEFERRGMEVRRQEEEERE